jgi:hypothetical protein
VTTLSSSRACAIGSSSSSGSSCFDCFLLSGEATSNTLFPTLSWKLARGSTGSGLAERGASSIVLSRLPRPNGLVGLTFSSVFRLDAGPQVLRLLGVIVTGSFSCLLFLRAKGLLKKPLFLVNSSTGLGSGSGDWGASGLPGEADPLGGSMLEKELGFE